MSGVPSFRWVVLCGGEASRRVLALISDPGVLIAGVGT
jgi:hypothetical protein